jgi:hypothetical protein
MSFTFIKPFSVGNKSIQSQEDLNKIFINPDDEPVREAIKAGVLGYDRDAFEANAAAESKGIPEAKKSKKPEKE